MISRKPFAISRILKPPWGRRGIQHWRSKPLPAGETRDEPTWTGVDDGGAVGVRRDERTAEEPGRAIALGDKAPNSNSLRDLHGNRRSLHDFTGHKAVVLVFLGAECPISNLYVPGLVALEKKYRDKQVQFLAVYPNERREDLDQVAGHAYDRDVPFPVLKDFGQKLADRARRHAACRRSSSSTAISCCATAAGSTTATASAARRPKATRDDLAEALDEVLAGKKVSVAETEADGCLLDRGAASSRRRPT